MTQHIKTERTVTTIDTYRHDTLSGRPPQTVITTSERTHGVAGGPRDQEGTLADHVAALRAIGAHSAATEIEHGSRPDTVTLGFQTRLEGNWLTA